MKIAFLNIYQGGVERGLETYITELSNRLGKHHGVKIFGDKTGPLGRWPYVWRFYLDPHGIKIALFTLKLLPKLWKEKYDIVFPLNGGWQPAFIRILTWLRGGKVVISGQSGIGWDDRNNLWCFPDTFVALTPKAKKWAERANPLSRRIVLIPNGVDLKKFSFQGPTFKAGIKKPIILCVGALTEQKRIGLVIDAVSKLKDVSLLVAGDGERKRELSEKGQRLLGNRFELVNVKHERMPEVYRTADLFTLVPKGSEAFGIVYVEAMASNLPVVTIDDEQRRQIIDGAGMFVDNPDNAGSYAKVIKDALKRNWGDKPRRQAEKYGWDRIADEYERLFKELKNEK